MNETMITDLCEMYNDDMLNLWRDGTCLKCKEDCIIHHLFPILKPINTKEEGKD